MSATEMIVPGMIVPQRRGVDMYDPREVQRLVEEEGLSLQDAIRVAATTIDGVRVDPDGRVNGTQTDCDYLHYSE